MTLFPILTDEQALKAWLLAIRDDDGCDIISVMTHIQKHFTDEMWTDLGFADEQRRVEWLASAYNLIDILALKLYITVTPEVRLQRLQLKHESDPGNSTPMPPIG